MLAAEFMDAFDAKQWASWGLAMSLSCWPLAAQEAPESPAAETDQPATEAELESDPERNQLDLANRLYEQAKSERQAAPRQQAFQQLIPFYERFLENFPESPYTDFVHYRLGYSHLVARQAEPAERYFTLVVRNSENAELKSIAAHRLGSLLMGRGFHREAAKNFVIAANEAPQDSVKVDALYRLGRCYVKTGNRKAAITAFEKVVANELPSNPFADASRLYLGNLLLREEKYDQALELFDQLTQADRPDKLRGEAALQAGRIATQLGKLDRANRYFTLLLNTDSMASWRGEAQLGLMANYYESEDWKQVIRLYEKHRIVMPEAQDARRMLLYAKALFELKRYAQASLAFANVERLIPRTPQSFKANYYRLVCGYEQRLATLPRQVDAFLEVYQARHPDSPLMDRALLLKAETLYNGRQMAAAADAYRALDPEKLPAAQKADALYRSGWVLTEIEEYAIARNRLDAFIEGYPDHKERGQALVKRAFCRIKLGDDRGGLRDFSVVVKEFPKTKMASFALQQSALIYGKLGNDEKMVSLFEILIRDFPTLKPAALAEAHYWMGRGLFDQDNFAEALPHLEEARQLVPEKYKARAGNLAVMCQYALANVSGLKEAVDRLLADAPKAKIAPTVLAWLGLQSAKVGDYESTDRYLTLASNPAEPKTTKKLVWRNLSRARLELRRFHTALQANTNYLAEEKQDFFIAEGNLERARILLGLERPAEAREAVETALGLNPQGALLANLRLSLGEVEFAEGNFEKAASHFIVVAELFANDDQLKPLAKFRAAQALENAGKSEEAAKHREDLKKDYPKWKAPKD